MNDVHRYTACYRERRVQYSVFEAANGLAAVIWNHTDKTQNVLCSLRMMTCRMASSASLVEAQATVLPATFTRSHKPPLWSRAESVTEDSTCKPN